ncbi:hypothetical protein BBJ28_00006718 [Nothophytophthora sp. Chile5]|nr:hypothetical protein BBJ28_00006718 [Nothophytophthora sp. Chile5]
MGGNAAANDVATNLDELRWLEHRWLDRHGKNSRLKERREQLVLMRRWFDSLDTDGSGEVGLAELEDPLVSVGLAHSREDVQQLIDDVGGVDSGGVSFDTFLSLLHPDRVKRGRVPRLTLALHQPKHQPPARPETSPKTSEAGVLASPLAAEPRRPHQSINIKKPDANPVVQLFEDLQAGRLGDLAIPFPVLITAYRRRMLLNAHMAEDPSAKRCGAAMSKCLHVLKVAR